MAGLLITALVNLYVDDNAATDAISERLREVCPSLYSIEDALCSKVTTPLLNWTRNRYFNLVLLVTSQGNEKLQSARVAKTTSERAAQLQESLSLFKQVAPQLDMSVVCNQFVQARFFSGNHSHLCTLHFRFGCAVTSSMLLCCAGVVDLSLTAAAKRDPQQLALHFYKNGQPAEDTQGNYFYSAR